jgi:hypothetical protein
LQLHTGIGGICVRGAGRKGRRASKEGLLLSIGETLIVSRQWLNIAA